MFISSLSLKCNRWLYLAHAFILWGVSTMSDTLPDALAQAWSVTKYAVYHSVHISVIGSCFDLYILKNNNNGPVLVSRDGRHRRRRSGFYPVTSYTHTTYNNIYKPRNRTGRRCPPHPPPESSTSQQVRFVIPPMTANVAHANVSIFVIRSFPCI